MGLDRDLNGKQILWREVGITPFVVRVGKVDIPPFPGFYFMKNNTTKTSQKRNVSIDLSFGWGLDEKDLHGLTPVPQHIVNIGKIATTKV